MNKSFSQSSQPKMIRRPARRVAVIGAGLSGIGNIISLKEEGIEPVCFEKTDKFGGTWYYREEVEDGLASIMATTTLNHSKEMGAISNFPPKKEYSNYMRHTECYQYASDYVKASDCERYIRYNMEVLQVKRTEDYEKTGRWFVTVKNRLTGQEITEIFDAVVVAVGYINRPKMPTYTGQDLFKGKIMHTHSLKRATEFEGKKVVVVGIGCSALDAAVEISSVAKQVYLSTRSGAFILNRVGPKGYPFDYIIVRRWFTTFLDVLPSNICSLFIEKMYLDPSFHHKMYAVRPKYHVLSKEPTVNDCFASKLLSGAVIQKPDISNFTENGVVFLDETWVTKVDAVVMATGYTWKFPFLEEGIVVKEGDRINLYKCMHPPHLPHPTLVISGFFRPFGPGIPPGELQCRWTAQLFAQKCHLPSEKKMMESIKKRHKANKKRYAPTELISLHVDFVQYMDELASEIGVKPNFFKIFFTDPKLFYKLWFGPCLPYQYRLRGPHKWEGAREAIMTCRERIYWPLQRKGQQNTDL